MMLGSTLRHTVTEWQPITSSPGTAAVFFLAAGIAVWSFGRHASRTTLWERLALLVLVAGSISVIRNILFFGLFALMVMPVWLAIGARAQGATEPQNVPPRLRSAPPRRGPTGGADASTPGWHSPPPRRS